MDNLRLIDLLPQPYYQDVYEMALLMTVEQYQIDALQQAIDAAQNNFYAIVADSDGLAIFEQMLGITGVTGMDIESRRYNVIAKLLPPRPITIQSFNEVLQALNISATISVTGFTVNVNVSTTDNNALKRLNSLLASHLPANLLYTAFNFVQTSPNGTTVHGTDTLFATRITTNKSSYAQ